MSSCSSFLFSNAALRSHRLSRILPFAIYYLLFTLSHAHGSSHLRRRRPFDAEPSLLRGRWIFTEAWFTVSPIRMPTRLVGHISRDTTLKPPPDHGQRCAHFSTKSLRKQNRPRPRRLLSKPSTFSIRRRNTVRITTPRHAREAPTRNLRGRGRRRVRGRLVSA